MNKGVCVHLGLFSVLWDLYSEGDLLHPMATPVNFFFQKISLFENLSHVFVCLFAFFICCSGGHCGPISSLCMCVFIFFPLWVGFG